LKEWSAEEVATMPYYYIMPLHSSMPEAVQLMMQDQCALATKTWLTDSDLKVYVDEWRRTGFQRGAELVSCQHRIVAGK
jgi:hypothetical protein